MDTAGKCDLAARLVGQSVRSEIERAGIGGGAGKGNQPRIRKAGWEHDRGVGRIGQDRECGAGKAREHAGAAGELDRPVLGLQYTTHIVGEVGNSNGSARHGEQRLIDERSRADQVAVLERQGRDTCRVRECNSNRYLERR